MADPARRALLSDIGGTNARFAFVTGERMGPIETLAVGDYPEFDRALAAFLGRHRNGRPISGAVLAVAGSVEASRSILTNSGWVIDASRLEKAFDLPSVRVVNDFKALAWSLPHLAPSDLFAVGGDKQAAAAPAVVLGPGTGLGLACLVPRPRDPLVVTTEAGHTTLPGANAREDAVIAHLRGCFGHVSVERALSGPGLVNLYQSLAAIDHLSVPPRKPSQITEAALRGSCPASREALDMFCAMLGTVAGNAALTFGARGGVYIGGGIAPRISEYLARSQFRARFEAKGRFQAYVAAIPSWVIMHPDPAFVGLQRLANHEAEQ
ncbi:glucokinase [Nitrobacter vulgaris]|uniref:Glucokinase n=1 Tax=Nitrobacter vulgaris TaxID=29421 RepID=A0A1V4HTM3_NITVU|nr:glucokinase [Nitrobacter vulgaris]OPH81326.1 glucokinase [Nitrobacter vulgaris]